jgi:hypothetical protein
MRIDKTWHVIGFTSNPRLSKARGPSRRGYVRGAKHDL